MANDNVNEKLTALADEIRELSGTTDKLGIDEMTSALSTENTNFSSNLSNQDSLIEQIKTALQNKAASGEGEDVAPFVQKTLTEYSNDSLTYVGPYGFGY